MQASIHLPDLFYVYIEMKVRMLLMITAGHVPLSHQLI